MYMSYDHTKIERKWQKAWAKNPALTRARDGAKGKKMYVLDMFPYPSGEGLHVGHTEGEVATDIYARFLRMRGYNVLHPMGWDAFGLPAENFAIKHKVHPAKVVKKNVTNFKKQMTAVGLAYDWSREINTTDPAYYRWTQWIFLKLFEHGLAYEAEAPINFCPSCKTGLANEEVVGDGACERCGTKVERRNMRQWMLKITAYADLLLKDIDALDWSEQLKAMQRNWIGRSEGSELDFHLYHEKQDKVLFALINEKGETLLERRKGGAFAGKLLFPGGRIEEGDADMVRSAMREIREETGFGARSIEYLGFLGYFYPTADKGRIPLLVFRVKKKNAKPAINTGHEMKWQSVDDMPKEYGHSEFVKMFEGVREAARTGKIFSDVISVFTTRADTLFGATYVVLAPEHPLVQENILGIENYNEVSAYCAAAKNKSDLERTAEAKKKTGVRLLGVKAVNPVNGRAIPVYVADYVLFRYGTGAVMAVPAHDERDFEFAQAHGLPVEEVIAQGRSSAHEPENLLQAFTDDGVLVRSGKFSGMISAEARAAITKATGGRSTVNYKLHDWVFSRQRYWGEPIPLVFCNECKKQAELKTKNSKQKSQFSKGELLNPGWIAMKEKDMPLKLPNVKSYEPSGTGESPLANIEKWVKTKCPRCGGAARRETNTMPQWAGSCWYYLRFIDPHNTKALVDKKKEKQWMPVDVYVGGAEHAVLHLLYARFWHKFLYDIGVVSSKEPFRKLINQGLILGPDKQKMSKSRGNVVNPLETVAQLGADVLRMYEMFMGPLEDAKPWDTSGIAGIRRFLERTHRIISKSEFLISKRLKNSQFETLLHKTIKKVTEDIESFRFNTAISAMMILLNEMEKQSKASGDSCRLFVKLLAPFAPHLAEEMWEMLGGEASVHAEKWPTYNKKLIVEDAFDLVVQVNGKVRDVMRAPKGTSQAEAEALARASEKVKKFIEGKEIRKKIFVPDRLINIIV